MAETLEDIGEFGLISRIAKTVYTSSNLALDFRDDAALWQQGSGWLIATTDAVVEDVDFRLNTFSWEDIGWKALAVNLSDIAAMGGTPRGAFVTLCLPATCETAAVSAFYRGMSLLAEETDTPILGGDLSASAQLVANVAVIGEVESSERVLKRKAAQVGDQIAVTGVLGSAAAGLALLERGDSGDTPHGARFMAAQRRPAPRLREGRALVDMGVRCGMDVSDGLSADLKKLCLASDVAAELKLGSIPTDASLGTVFGDSFRERAIGGGEDFELLFTAPPAVMNTVEAWLSSNSLAPCTVIGAIVPGPHGAVVVRDVHGRVVPVSNEGFDHFGTAAAPLSGN